MGWDNPLEKEMATRSSPRAWETPWTEEPDGLQSMGSQRVRQDSVTITTKPKPQQYRKYTMKTLKLSYREDKM